MTADTQAIEAMTIAIANGRDILTGFIGDESWRSWSDVAIGTAIYLLADNARLTEGLGEAERQSLAFTALSTATVTRLTAALAEAEGQLHEGFEDVATDCLQAEERAGQAEAARAEASERNIATHKALQVALTALAETEKDRCDWEDLYEETKHQWRKAEADAATGRAVARRYRDEWHQLGWPTSQEAQWVRTDEYHGTEEAEPMTPAEAAYLASLSDEPT